MKTAVKLLAVALGLGAGAAFAEGERTRSEREEARHRVAEARWRAAPNAWDSSTRNLLPATGLQVRYESEAAELQDPDELFTYDPEYQDSLVH